ncbi:S26 family signal peptidase [Streptomyces sp. H27-D2]|uniref:S26 family signal peptidase n=1 Tax=Streptomyces sp. H27-D2 TaxID=3046304 RepID=UPI002DB728C6|nr:S26 family signal peptidase [Streptomyces sp. H27-D2]MEC4016330.1 S26 family signal peptidase [Streptomyces sp. H27-D2]
MTPGPPLLLLGTVTTALLLRRALVSVAVHGSSMEPAYHDGDRILVLRARTPSAGQVVVVERPGPGTTTWPHSPLARGAGAAALSGRQWMIKRVSATPGDPIPRHVPQPPPHRAMAARAHTGAEHVPPGSLVLLGDNAHASLDSRQVGYFPAARILGVVLLARAVHRRPRPTPGAARSVWFRGGRGRRTR